VRNEGVDALRAFLASRAAPGAWPLPRGEATDLSAAELAVELVREKLYRRLNQELPYRLSVSLRGQRPLPGGGLRIELVVTVPSATLRKIVVGAGGRVMEDYVVARSRHELEHLLRVPIHLVVPVEVGEP